MGRISLAIRDKLCFQWRELCFMKGLASRSYKKADAQAR
jgi:hypothetical protein